MNELRAARIISAVAHPLVLTPVTVALATGNLRWTAILAAGTLLPMVAVMMWKVRSGAWTDYDVSQRDQRPGLYWIAIPLLLLTAIFIDAPSQFKRGMFAVAVILMLGLAGNRWLKTSMHMMFAAYCAVILARVYPWSLALTLPIALALAWSRLRLERHTMVEVIAGVLLGVAAGAYVVWV